MRFVASSSFSLVLAFALLHAPLARAEVPAVSPAPEKSETKSEPKKDDKKIEMELRKLPKRRPPDYGNRGPAPTTAGDVALTGLRVLMSPFYFLTEFVIRRPLEIAIPAAERANLPKSLYDLFLFGPNHKAGVLPTFLADFGLRPSVGLYGFWNDAIVPQHDFTAHGSTWGPDWLAGGITDRVRFTKGSTDNESLTLSAVARPDRPFYGIGPRSLQSSESRYGALRIELMDTIDAHVGHHVILHSGVGARAIDFYGAHNEDGDPTIAQSIASGLLPAPPGYLHDYTVVESELRVAVDSRGAKSSGTGVRLEAGGAFDSNVRDGARASWVKYGGSLTGAIDLNGRHRVLSLSFTALFVDPVRHEDVIPFTDLVSLGGTQMMRAYLIGRMIDRSALVTTLEYRWPVWDVLDGTIKAEFGNVFDAHLDDFNVNLLRFSGSIGVQTAGVADNPLQLLFGVGTETFEHGGQIDSFRLLVGTTANGI